VSACQSFETPINSAVPYRRRSQNMIFKLIENVCLSRHEVCAERSYLKR